jgi:hypothetical protein
MKDARAFLGYEFVVTHNHVFNLESFGLLFLFFLAHSSLHLLRIILICMLECCNNLELGFHALLSLNPFCLFILSGFNFTSVLL